MSQVVESGIGIVYGESFTSGGNAAAIVVYKKAGAFEVVLRQQKAVRLSKREKNELMAGLLAQVSKFREELGLPQSVAYDFSPLDPLVLAKAVLYPVGEAILPEEITLRKAG